MSQLTFLANTMARGVVAHNPRPPLRRVAYCPPGGWQPPAHHCGRSLATHDPQTPHVGGRRRGTQRSHLGRRRPKTAQIRPQMDPSRQLHWFRPNSAPIRQGATSIDIGQASAKAGPIPADATNLGPKKRGFDRISADFDQRRRRRRPRRWSQRRRRRRRRKAGRAEVEVAVAAEAAAEAVETQAVETQGGEVGGGGGVGGGGRV